MAKASGTFRIFVSSTFKDLTEERNILQVMVFPKLKQLCLSNGYRFQAIDLRWGIRDEAGVDQRTMTVCLDELARCQKVTPRPNFILLLGERYGWRPLPEVIDADEFEKIMGEVKDEKDRELLSRWYRRDDNNVPPIYYLKARTGEYKDWDRWLEEEGRIRSVLMDAATKIELGPEQRFKYVSSATEQEIVKGAMKVKDAAEHVFAFFRTIKGMPVNSSAEEYLDLDEGGSPIRGMKERVDGLKDKLEEKIAGNIHEYNDVEWVGQDPKDEEKPPITTDHLYRFCNDVYRSLSRVIEEQMETLEMDTLEREVEEHRIFGEARSEFFTGRASMLKTIRDYIESDDNHPLAVFGEGGTGKSALSAYAALKAEKEYSNSEVIFRFIGATPGSSDGRTLLEGLCRQLTKEYGGDESTVPSTYEDLKKDFPGRLSLATGEKPLTLFIDSLDQLTDAYNAKELTWLPGELPRNVRMVLTTRPGRPLAALRKKVPAENIEQLGPMSEEEGSELLEKWLVDAKRTLQEPQREEVLGEFEEAKGNPLYLRMAFGEARLWRSDTEDIDLNPEIEGIIGDLYGRLSSDVNHGNTLVSRSLAYLAASRNGLSEDEIIDILSSDEEVYDDFTTRAHFTPPQKRLPISIWSRLYYDLAPYLAETTSEGATLLTFYHRELGEVAKKDYVTGDEEVERHLFLADYFDAQPLGPRKVDELPWQLSQAKAWQRLYDLLSDLPFFDEAYVKDQFDVKSYWAQVERSSDLKMVDAYQPALKSPERHETHQISRVAALLYETGHPKEALSLQEYLVGYFRETGNKDGISASLNNKAVILSDQGDLDGAMKLYKELERICRETGNNESLQASLGNQANILRDWGDLDGAMELHKEEERICREFGNKDGLAISLGNQALILSSRGDLDEAMELHKEAERIFRELGNRNGLQVSLGNQALILYDRGDLDGAMKLHKEKERICRELGNKDGLAVSLGNQALILRDWGDLDEAMELHKEEERICRKLGNKDRLAVSLGNQALILRDWGDLDGAMELHKEEERICRELGNKDRLAASLGNQANILRDRGDLDGAMELHRETERICRELGNKDGLAVSLGNQALILADRGDLDEAMELHKEAERIFRELGSKDKLVVSLGNQAIILRARGDLDGAMELHKEAERICRELGNKDGLQRSLGNQAAILRARGDLDGAMKLLKETERIFRELGDKDGLAVSLDNQANILYSRGDLDEAVELHKEAERICRELGNRNGLQESLGSQALILSDRGNLDGAMKLHKEKERICRELGNKDGLAVSLGNQAAILARKGTREGLIEALSLAEEAYKLAMDNGLTATARQIKPLLDKIRSVV